MDSLIYILSYTKEDFSVVQKENFADIKIGISNANEREKKAVEEFRRLLQEAYDVGKAKGVHLEEEDIVRHQNRFENKLADDATSSLQRDVEAGKRNTELETFCGYIVRVGRELGVDVSLTEKFYRMDS